MPDLVAILCSGQGGQHPAMFDLVANCPEAEPVFAAAAAVWGRDPRTFVKEAASADLFSDFTGQILCCAQALAAWAALGTVRPARAVIAGYSIGELAAWRCAGTFDELSILRLAQRRAAAMDDRKVASRPGASEAPALSKPAFGAGAGPRVIMSSCETAGFSSAADCAWARFSRVLSL